MAVIASFGVASSLASSYKAKDGSPIDGIPAGVLAVAVFFVVTEAGRLAEDVVLGMNSENLFVAMFFAIITAEIYRVFVQKEWIIKMPETVPTAIARQFSALLPGAVVLGGAWLLIAIPFSYTPFVTVSAWLNEGLFSWLVNVGLSYPGIMIGSFLEHLLWCFGLHGSAIVIFPFFEPLYLSVTTPGTTAIVTWPFYENGVWIGGSGATLPAVVYMLLFAKSRLCKDIGKIAIGPGIFNINEPVTFGLPVVLNPMLMIPYILSPLVIITIMYTGTAVGIFPILDKMVPWTTPIFVSGFLAASGGIGSSIMGLVAQVICFAVALLIWFPFIRAWDNVNVKREAGLA
jgi:PTS system cellobiose-specific IIC component